MRVAIWSNLSRDLPGWSEALEIIRGAGHEILDPGSDDLSDEAAEVLAGAAAIVVGLNQVTKGALAHASEALVIAKPGIGVDNVDVAAATALGIAVCNTPGSNAEAVADHTFALALAVLRDLVRLNNLTRNGQGWDNWPHVGRQLGGGVIAVVGTGNIGQAVIRRAVRGFDMKALAFDLRPNHELEREYRVRYGRLDDVLPEADVVTVHVPLTDSTRNLIGAAELSLLKPTAVLVNTSRGGVVDEAALATALAAGKLSGAGVDVFDQEPSTDSSLYRCENAILTPHIAGYSPQASLKSRLMTAENVVAALANSPRNVVNPDVLGARWSRLGRLKS